MTCEINVKMGRLYVVNKPAILTCLGLGSCVALMLHDKEAKVSGLAHIMLSDSNKARFSETSYNVVLAENNEYCVKTFKNSIASMGYEIQAITDSTELTIRKYREINPRLLLLDANLTKNCDFDLIEEILKMDGSANIVVTNVDSSTDYLDFFAKGAIDFISRPVTREKITQSFDIINSVRHIRFADVAIEKMLNRMLSEGASIKNIRAKMAGGANMFNHSQTNSRNIGEENSSKIDEILKEKGIYVVARDVGSNFGRTVRFNTEEFSVSVKSKEGIKEI